MKIQHFRQAEAAPRRRPVSVAEPADRVTLGQGTLGGLTVGLGYGAGLGLLCGTILGLSAHVANAAHYFDLAVELSAISVAGAIAAPIAGAVIGASCGMLAAARRTPRF